MLKRKKWEYKTIAGQAYRKKGKKVQGMWLKEWCNVPAEMWDFYDRYKQTGGEVMDLNAYHRALCQGFSESEAEAIGEDAYIDAMCSRTSDPPEPVRTCDICGEHEAVTGVNGYGVCSEDCGYKAEDM